MAAVVENMTIDTLIRINHPAIFWSQGEPNAGLGDSYEYDMSGMTTKRERNEITATLVLRRLI